MAQHSFVLSRRVRRAPDLVERALPGLACGDHGGLTRFGEFERRTIVGPWGSGPPDRHACAELRVGRRLREPVEVELGAWARDAAEIRLRPTARRPERWSGRRQRQFFESAHAAIDSLASTLEQRTPVGLAAHHLATRSA